MTCATEIDMEAALGILMRDAFILMQRALRHRLDHHGIVMSQWMFLRVLWEEEGLTQRTLSRRARTSEPTAVVLLKGLEKDGLIYRARDDHDRRVTRVYLTDKSRALKDDLLHYVPEVISEATRGLSADEVASLSELLAKVRANMAAYAPAG